MADLNKKAFYAEVISHLEEIELLYDEREFDIDETELDENSEEFEAEDLLVRFINHIRDAKDIAESNS